MKLLPSQSFPADFCTLMLQHAHRPIWEHTAFPGISAYTDTVTFTVPDLVSMVTLVFVCQGGKSVKGQDETSRGAEISLKKE